MANVLYEKSALMVKKQNILYPVTHLFVVKEEEVEADWLDEFDGQILECYNYFSYGTGDYIQPPMGSRQGGSINVSMTFACINLESIYDGIPGLLDRYTGDQFGMAFQRCNASGEPVPPYDITGWLIGHTSPYSNYSGYHYAGKKEIVTMSAGSPGGIFGKLDGVGGWLPLDKRSKDLVFWLYACQITDTTTEYADDMDTNYTFNPATSTYPHSDELFLPGQRGYRIISNKWKYAPWERYPALS